MARYRYNGNGGDGGDSTPVAAPRPPPPAMGRNNGGGSGKPKVKAAAGTGVTAPGPAVPEAPRAQGHTAAVTPVTAGPKGGDEGTDRWVPPPERVNGAKWGISGAQNNARSIPTPQRPL